MWLPTLHLRLTLPLSPPPAELQALSNSVTSYWKVTTGNANLGTVCGWVEDARFPGLGSMTTTSVDYNQQDITGTIPTQVCVYVCVCVRVCACARACVGGVRALHACAPTHVCMSICSLRVCTWQVHVHTTCARARADRARDWATDVCACAAWQSPRYCILALTVIS